MKMLRGNNFYGSLVVVYYPGGSNCILPGKFITHSFISNLFQSSANLLVKISQYIIIKIEIILSKGGLKNE